MHKMNKIGQIGPSNFYYCAATDEFMILDAVSTAILEAFDAGASLDEVKRAFEVNERAPTSATISLIWQHFSAQTPTAPQANSISNTYPVANVEKFCHFDYDSHLRINCGQVSVNLYANQSASQALFPHFAKYFTIQSPNDVLPVVGSLWLTGHDDGLMTLHVDQGTSGMTPFHGEAGACFVEAARVLSEFACDYPARLAVLHAATLVRDEKTIILINPSGSGKTTLAWLLSMAGFALVHDDCLPVNPDGAISQLLTPSTIKQGSWKVLENAGLALHEDVFERARRLVRYQPIVPFLGPLSAGRKHIMFISYEAGCSARLTNVDPVEAFTRLIAEECVIKDRSIDRLKSIFNWVVASRAAELRYDRFVEAVKLIENWLNDESF
jgi:hypothetical protein